MPSLYICLTALGLALCTRHVSPTSSTQSVKLLTSALIVRLHQYYPPPTQNSPFWTQCAVLGFSLASRYPFLKVMMSTNGARLRSTWGPKASRPMVDAGLLTAPKLLTRCGTTMERRSDVPTPREVSGGRRSPGDASTAGNSSHIIPVLSLVSAYYWAWLHDAVTILSFRAVLIRMWRAEGEQGGGVS